MKEDIKIYKFKTNDFNMSEKVDVMTEEESNST